MKIYKVTYSGRLTIPAEIHKKYGLISGRKIKFEETENGILTSTLFTKK